MTTTKSVFEEKIIKTLSLCFITFVLVKSWVKQYKGVYFWTFGSLEFVIHVFCNFLRVFRRPFFVLFLLKFVLFCTLFCPFFKELGRGNPVFGRRLLYVVLYAAFTFLDQPTIVGLV